MRCSNSAFLLGIALLTGCNDAKRINGGGASFIYPAMLVWSREYEKMTGIQIDYQSTGSGNGVSQTIARTIDFGCTDAFIKDDKLKDADAINGEVIHIPLAMGGVVPIYNLPGLDAQLNFTGTVLADIFRGTILKWNDPAIAEINPGVSLPNRDIVTIWRSDSSGTTAIFTDYLSRVSPVWKETIKSGTTVNWPRGVGQRGNEGVAGQVQRSPHAIGYVELIFAKQNKLEFGRVESRDSSESNAAYLVKTGTNKPLADRTFLAASPESVTAAANAVMPKIPADLRYSLTNVSGPKSYPISGSNWAVFYRKQPAVVAAELKLFLEWATQHGGEAQKLAQDLGYSPLPEPLTALIRKKLELLVAVTPPTTR